jgi:hypothetical protein
MNAFAPAVASRRRLTLKPSPNVARHKINALPEQGEVQASHYLGIYGQIQTLTNWCWAACIASIQSTCSQQQIDQCVVAGSMLHTQCCPASNSFNYTQDASEIQAYFTGIGYSYSAYGRSLSYNEIDQITNGGFIIAGLRFWNTSGHVVVVCGVDGGSGVWVWDPDPGVGGGWWNFGYLSHACGGGSWQESIANIHP